MGRISAAVQRLLFEGSPHKRRLLVLLGVAGILLIAASELLPRREAAETASGRETETALRPIPSPSAQRRWSRRWRSGSRRCCPAPPAWDAVR